MNSQSRRYHSRALVGLSFSFVLVITSGSRFLWGAEANGTPTETWIGNADLNGKQVPFRLELQGTGEKVVGTLVNGRERYASSSGILSGDHVILHFDYYANTMDANMTEGVLNGTFGGRSHGVSLTAQVCE